MHNTVHAFIKQHHLISEHSTVVLGLSGGPDSLFLLHALAPLHHNNSIRLIAAHLDHEWRKDSGDDVLFCQQAAQALAIPFESMKASELGMALRRNGSQEELGRKLRRAFLEQVAHKHGAAAIALGHHAQDQQETFFIRLIRGTTLSGLVGMRPKQGLYIRPLLEMNKDEIVAWLKENKIAYLVDPTNTHSSYLRNRIRLQVVPALLASDARFPAQFLRAVQHLQSAELVLEQVTQDAFTKITQRVNGRNEVAVDQLFMLHEYVQGRVLTHWFVQERVPFTVSELFIKEVIRFLKQPGDGIHRLGTTWALQKRNGVAHIEKVF